MKKTYIQLKEEFEKEVIKLQIECNHPITKLKIDKDHSVVGRGSIYPKIDIRCKICEILNGLYFKKFVY